MVRILCSLLLLALALAVGGCASAVPLLLSEAMRPDEVTISPAGEDGTRYLAVEGGPLSSARTLRTRWNATARKVCDGEFQRLSDAGTTRRADGITRSRIHEGFVQCLLPGDSEPGRAGGPDLADATAKPSPTRRRPRRR